MTLKDGRELNYWKQADMEYHRAKLSVYLWTFGHYINAKSVLEIGPGPLGGVLSLIGRPHRLSVHSDKRRVGVDSLAGIYAQHGLRPDDPDIQMITAQFEDWKTDEKFDAIFAIDSLDHGEMSFHLLPKIAGLLNPGGRFYLHVHMRPKERLDATHDHSLTLPDYEKYLAISGMKELSRTVYPQDIDGQFDAPALVTVCQK